MRGLKQWLSEGDRAAKLANLDFYKFPHAHEGAFMRQFFSPDQAMTQPIQSDDGSFAQGMQQAEGAIPSGNPVLGAARAAGKAYRSASEGGEKIKQIGMAARLDIERFLGKKVFLELWCKVIPGWKSNAGFLRESQQH